MACYRCVGLAVISVALALSFTSVTPAQTPLPQTLDDFDRVVVYPVGALADDPKFGKWVCETIPEMVCPGTWSVGAAKRRITYYAPGKVLVVCHNNYAQAEVRAFLTQMQQATAGKNRTATTESRVMPAHYTEVRPSEATPGVRGGYPIPMPAKQPKHLFHLILRYEGDGLDDNALSGLMSQLNAGDPKKEKDKEPCEKPAPDAKGPSLGQLLHFIVRYEGDGIIDSNVASLLRDIYGAGSGGGPRAWTPAPVLGGSVPVMNGVGLPMSCAPTATQPRSGVTAPGTAPMNSYGSATVPRPTGPAGSSTFSTTGTPHPSATAPAPTGSPGGSRTATPRGTVKDNPPPQ